MDLVAQARGFFEAQVAGRVLHLVGEALEGQDAARRRCAEAIVRSGCEIHERRTGQFRFYCVVGGGAATMRFSAFSTSSGLKPNGPAALLYAIVPSRLIT